MRITKFMRRSIASVNPEATLREIEELMERRKIRHVLVIEKGELLGIISDRDVKKYRSLFAETKAAKEIDEATLRFRAHQIMTRDPITIHEDIRASDTIKLMLEEHISCLPVLDNDNAVIGVVTSSDLMKWVLGLFEFIE
jgi:acetoin utilization protein AcuB